MSNGEMHPTVSVVIPTYNRAGLIGRSIRSVLNQTFRDFELIVIDDGSTDETSDLVAEFHDPRIACVRLPRNRGAGAARNAGIRMAKGKFLSFQDSDDEWLAGKLAKQLQAFETGSPRVGVVYSDMERVWQNGDVTYYASPAVVSGRLVNPRALHSYQVFGLGIQSTLIRRECFDVVGCFNEKLKAFEDLELFIRLSRQYDFCHIQERLVRYYETDGVSKDINANLSARSFLLRLYGSELLMQHPFFFLYECFWLCKTQLHLILACV